MVPILIEKWTDSYQVTKMTKYVDPPYGGGKKEEAGGMAKS
jgi:hypothetical protein